jgi:hypothetical protein
MRHDQICRKNTSMNEEKGQNQTKPDERWIHSKCLTYNHIQIMKLTKFLVSNLVLNKTIQRHGLLNLISLTSPISC